MCILFKKKKGKEKRRKNEKNMQKIGFIDTRAQSMTTGYLVLVVTKGFKGSSLL